MEVIGVLIILGVLITFIALVKFNKDQSIKIKGKIVSKGVTSLLAHSFPKIDVTITENHVPLYKDIIGNTYPVIIFDKSLIDTFSVGQEVNLTFTRLQGPGGLMVDNVYLDHTT